MHKHVIFPLFLTIFLSLFTPCKSISSQASQMSKPEIHELECIDALSIPQVPKKVGASNIQIMENADAKEITQIRKIIEEKKDKALEFMGFISLDENNKDDLDEINLYIELIGGNLLYTISFPINGKMKNIPLRIEKEEVYDVFEDAEVLKEIKDVLGELPEIALSLVNNILITYKRYEKEDSSIQTLGKTEHKDTIAIYIHNDVKNLLKDVLDNIKDTLSTTSKGAQSLTDSDTDLLNMVVLDHLKTTIQHELGHIIANQAHGESIPDQRWQNAILADGTSVSKYGDTAAEDLPETMLLYLETDGGIYYPDIAKKYAHRFAILDEFMGLSPFHRQQVNNLNHRINDLLKRLGFTINDFFEEIDIDTPDESFQHPVMVQLFSHLDLTLEKFADSQKPDKGFIAHLIESWKTRLHNIKIIKALLNKINTIPRDKLLNFTSIETRLTRETLKYVKHVWRDHKIPEFVIENVYLLDKLSIFEMRRRLRILEEANRFLITTAEESDYIVFEEALM